MRSIPLVEDIRHQGDYRPEAAVIISSESGWQPANSLQWRLVCAGILLAAAILRFANLDLKPLHHDEGINGYFLLRLLRNGFYRYDPANYHGPTLYYLAAITSGLNAFFFGPAGLNTFAIRAVPALFGVGTVGLVLGLRRRIGTVGAASAGLLIAISPGAVFLSRYFIHETPFVFFMLATVIAGLHYYETGETRHLMLSTTAAAFLFATKETAVITAVVVLGAFLCARTYVALRNRHSLRNGQLATQPNRGACDAPQRLTVSRNPRIWVVALLLFCAVNVLFYSSFFTNFPRGIGDSLRTFQIWAATAASSYRQVWYRHLQWLAEAETLLLLLGTAGAVLAMLRARSRLAVFVGLWWAGLLISYSLLPYKTPWLLLSVIIPLAISAGIGIEEISRICRDRFGRRQANWIMAGLSFALVLPARDAVTLDFYHYDDARYPYVYAQTQRGFLGLVDQISAVAARGGTGRDTTVAIFSPEYWPLPWYLRDYRNVAYYGRVAASDASIVVVSAGQRVQMYGQLGRQYRQVGSYPLRPGVGLVLFVRQDLLASKNQVNAH